MSHDLFRRFLLSLTFLAWLPLVAGAETARIEVENQTLRFGTVAQGEKVEQVFRFTNTGDALLKIEKVRSSCGCTAALLANRELQPEETGELLATFDSTRFQGPVVKTIYLYTNDPLQKVVQFHLRGEVRREVVVTPSRLALESINAGEELSARLEVANHGTREIVLEQVEVTAREARVDFNRQVLQPGESTDITVRVILPVGKDLLNAYVLVSLSGAVIKEQRIPLAVKAAR